jgi:putative transposase
MILAHKIRLSPTCKQDEYFACACGVSRFVYNWALERWNADHDLGKKPNGMSLKKEFNRLYEKQYPWIADVHRDCHARPFADLQCGFSSFFKGKAKHPRFHKKGDRDSFYIANDQLMVKGKKIRLPRIGWVKTREALRFDGKIMGATVSRTAGHWFIAVQVDVDEYRKERTGDSIVGVDLGLTTFATLSTGEKVDAPRPLKKQISKVRRASRRLSRKKKGGSNRKKQQRRLARLYARMASIRLDFIHKLTTKLCRENQTVVVEHLNVSGMERNRKLARAISDSSWAEFRRQLEYKAKIYGTHLIIAERFFPSSKTCSVCGYKKESLALSEREFCCEECGVSLDRDVNAALNLRTLGLRGSDACGEMGAQGPLVDAGINRLTSKKIAEG